MEKFHNDVIENKLISIILTVFNLNYEAVFSRCRKRELVICRQTIHTIFKNQLKFSSFVAGAVTGHDHATALNSYKKIGYILDTNFQPYANYIRKAKHLCSIPENTTEVIKTEPEENLIDFKYHKIKVKPYVFFEHSNLVL